MSVHGAAHSADWHTRRQVPNDTLKAFDAVALCATMTGDFREAFLRHVDATGATFADITKATGISRDVLNKLKARPESSTSAENAILIAAYFGKTVNQFVALQEVDDLDRIAALAELLTPEERRLLEAQIRGVIRAHEQQ